VDLSRRNRSGEGGPIHHLVRNDNRRPRLVRLTAACGALDIDDPQPAITIMMLPDEN
jgi:hypothetical protein